jgi:hypothetical protein
MIRVRGPLCSPHVAYPSMKSHQRGYLALIIILVIAIAAVAAWVWVALTWSYSEGERVGMVQKLSKKGWICKTWEGELNMVVLPGAIPDKFPFTVRDDRVADEINKVAGKRVSLQYQEHRFLPTTCFGETQHFVTGVKVLE